MSGGSITSRPKEEILHLPALNVVFPDRVTIRTTHQVETNRLMDKVGYQGVFDSDGVVVRESGREGNIYVNQTEGGTCFSGSIRNWADSVGLVPFGVAFGPEEAGLALDALGDAYGLPSGALHDGRLTLLEGAVDLALPRPASDYVRASEDLPRHQTVRWGDETVVLKTTRRQHKVYDPPAKFRSKGAPVPDVYLEAERAGYHVLRYEHTLRSGGVARHLDDWKDGDGVVRAGLLADPDFRGHLARLVVGQARRLRFGRVPVPERQGMTAGERRKWDAVRGIEASGGLDAALASVRAEHAAGHLTANQKKYRVASLRALFSDPAFTAVADLQAEFSAALDAVVTS